MKRAFLLASLLAGVFIFAGCHTNPIDRWLGINDDSESPATNPPAPTPAPAPTVTPTPTPLPRFETYRFEGVVKPGGTRYWGTVAPGDPVSGTFQIDFDQPLFAQNGTASIYRAFATIEGTVGGYRFSGTNNFLYVQPNVISPFRVDTGILTLDGQTINFDIYFFANLDLFPDGSLSNLRNLDRRSFTSIDFWLETFPGFGQGFNSDITRITRL